MHITLIEKQIKQCVLQWVFLQVLAPREFFLSKRRFPQDLSSLPKIYPVRQEKYTGPRDAH